MVLIQYKRRLPYEEEENHEKVKKESDDVIKWVDNVKKALKGYFEGYKIIYLYVTTGQISEGMKNKIKDSKDDYILYVDRVNMEFYTTTNLFPYLMSPSNEEIELLEFMENNKISKAESRYLTTREDLNRIIDFLKVKIPIAYKFRKYSNLTSSIKQ